MAAEHLSFSCAARCATGGHAYGSRLGSLAKRFRDHATYSALGGTIQRAGG